MRHQHLLHPLLTVVPVLLAFASWGTGIWSVS